MSLGTLDTGARPRGFAPRRLLPRDLGTPVWTAVLVLALLGTATLGYLLLEARQENALIRGLVAGRDLAIPADAGPELIRARAQFLLRYADATSAEALVAPMTGTGDVKGLAALWYDIGNRRLRDGFAAIDRQDVDGAAANVRLAKDAYRASLRLDPGAFDAKVNLDIASRLVRDFPSVEQEGEDDPEAQPKKVWTDLPGLPKGLP